MTPDHNGMEASDDFGWKLMYQFDTPSLSNRFSGQHSLCGVEVAMSIPLARLRPQMLDREVFRADMIVVCCPDFFFVARTRAR